MTQTAPTKRKHPSYEERVAELAEHDEQVAGHKPRLDLWEGLGDDSRPLADRVDQLLEGYGDRPALGERVYTLEDVEGDGVIGTRYQDEFMSISYGELRTRIRSIASAWQTQEGFKVNPDDCVCIMGFAGIDYTSLDTACLYAQAVSVPIQANYGFETLSSMLELVEPTAIATSVCDLEMATRLIEAIPSIRSLLVFDYHEGDAYNEADWEKAKKTLASSRPEVATATLDELVAMGDPEGYQMLPPHPEGTERLAAIVHSSGSTGTPKGAMLPERAVTGTWRSARPEVPTITVGLAPLNHILGRANVQGALGAGGLTNFALAPDMSTLIDDIRLTRPIYLALMPRILDMIYQDYLTQVSRRVDADGVSEDEARELVLDEFRGVYLGDRLRGGTVGSAPTSPEIRKFMMTCFDMPLANGYGNTESGTGMVTMGNRIQRPGVIDYKLRDLPELGYFTTDKPYPRGELCFKHQTQILGYYKNPEATAKLVDEEGFYRTGDVVEERGPDYVVVIDRTNDVLKLSQGEYVAVGRLETIFEGQSDLVEQTFIYGNSLRSYLVAVVVPDMQAMESALGKEPAPSAIHALIRDEFLRVGRDNDLKPFEIPREFIIDPDHFTTDNSLLTSVLKKKRPALQAKYRDDLEELYEKGEMLQTEMLNRLRDPNSDLSTVDKLRILLAANLGIEESEVDNGKSYLDHGGDSLGSLVLGMSIEEVFGVELASNDILSPAGGVTSWARILGGGDDRLPTYEEIHGTRKDEIFAADLQLSKFLSPEVLGAAEMLPPVAADDRNVVLLTGANGFLGRVICLEWLKRVAPSGGKVICLIRAADHEAAKKRLEAAFEEAGGTLASEFEGLKEHLEVYAGDFGQPLLGLTPKRFDQVAKQTDVVCHVGALVNHVMPYQALFAANVAGVGEIIRFALSGKKKPIDFVSSVGVYPHLQYNTGGGETAELAVSAKLNERYANGYGASKWAGEVLLREANQRFNLPVRIFRGDMMLAHRKIPGLINTEDMFSRLLYSIIKTGVAPKSFYEQNPDGSRALVAYDGTPVDIVAASVVDGGRFFKEGRTVFGIDNPYTDLYNSLDAFVDWIIEAGYPVQRLEAHEDWMSRFKRRLTALPEAEKKQSALALLKAFERPHSFVPFRGESSNFQDLIANIGITRADLQLDAHFLYKCLQDLASHGLIDPPAKKPSKVQKEKKETRSTPAYMVTSKSSGVSPTQIERRLPGPTDVAIDIEYTGICHSDIHFAHNDWGATQYPLVPGHEIMGRVATVGSEVSELTVGTRVAVGNMVDTCRKCDACRSGLEQYCDGGQVMTYNSYDHRHGNALTFGGYSGHIVADKDFVMTVPENLDPAGAAPLLCAGITTWSPLREWNIQAGMRVGVVGLGGLGHMALKFSKALGTHTVMITTSPSKADDARKLGAAEVLVSRDFEAMREAKDSFDFILDTVPVYHDLDDYVRLLKRDGTLCLVGALEPLDFHSGRLALRRKRIAGSAIGSIQETREMLDFCGEHNITSDIEVVKPDEINGAWERVLKNDVKYRFVIDMQS